MNDVVKMWHGADAVSRLTSGYPLWLWFGLVFVIVGVVVWIMNWLMSKMVSLGSIVLIAIPVLIAFYAYK